MYLGVIRSRLTAYSKFTIQHNRFFFVALRPKAGHGLLILEIF